MMKHKFCPDQNMLGKFMVGMPTTVEQLPPSPPKRNKFGKVVVKHVDEDEDEWKKKRLVFVHDEFPLEAMEYPWNDMMRDACNIVKFDITGVRILVCPKCKSRDLEPIYPTFTNLAPEKSEILISYDSRIERQCSMCRCPKCDVLFFLPEVVSMGSFRVLMPNEDSSVYYNYLTEVWFKGKWMVMLGAFIDDVSKSVFGKSFNGIDNLFRCIASEDEPDVLHQEASFF
jgi:hypothetical protein